MSLIVFIIQIHFTGFKLNIRHDAYYYSVMELEGEEVYTGWAYADGNNFYSESWSIDMPAAAAFVKTYLCDVVSLNEKSAVEIGILNIRYILPDNSNGRVNLDSLDWPNTIKAWFSPRITHFTFAVKARQCYALMCCIVDYWS
jgi:hypothetical protein